VFGIVRGQDYVWLSPSVRCVGVTGLLVARRQEEPLSEGRTGAEEDYLRGVIG
jgi:hypothetical protein